VFTFESLSVHFSKTPNSLKKTNNHINKSTLYKEIYPSRWAKRPWGQHVTETVGWHDAGYEYLPNPVSEMKHDALVKSQFIVSM